MQLLARNIHCGYKDNLVLKGVDLSIRKGEILCILGPNGSGKSTLFKAILGLIKISQGEVMFGDQNLQSMSRSQIARIIGYVPQTHDPPFPYKVPDVIMMGRTTYIGSFSSPAAQDYEVVSRVIESLKIEHLCHKAYTELSGGERQLVLIARALAQQPQVLIMDEPTASLDFGNQWMVWDQVQTLAASGLGIIVISHMPEHALFYSSRVVILKDGQIKGNGTPDEIVTRENMKMLYGVDTLITGIALNSGQMVKVCVPETNMTGGFYNAQNI